VFLQGSRLGIELKGAKRNHAGSRWRQYLCEPWERVYHTTER
jgi:hypothetical protein